MGYGGPMHLTEKVRIKPKDRVVISGFHPDSLRVFYLDGSLPDQIVLWSTEQVEHSASNGHNLPPQTKVVVYDTRITDHFSSQVCRIVSGKKIVSAGERNPENVNWWIGTVVVPGLCTGSELARREQKREELRFAARQEAIAEVKRKRLAESLKDHPLPPRVVYAHKVPLPVDEKPVEYKGKMFWRSPEGLFYFQDITASGFIWLNANYGNHSTQLELKRLMQGIKLLGLKELTLRSVEKRYYEYRKNAPLGK